MSVNVCFPTAIYSDILSEMESSRDSFISKAYEIQKNHASSSSWSCDTYTTISTEYELSKDPVFSSLIDECGKHVNNFAKIYGVANPITELNGAWINIASPGNYQEYHIHSGSHFSLVYYVKVVPKSGNIIFRNASSMTDMFPVDIDFPNDLNYKSCTYAPSNNKILIFRSNLFHMVEKNMSDTDRISIAMNFNIKKEDYAK